MAFVSDTFNGELSVMGAEITCDPPVMVMVAALVPLSSVRLPPLPAARV